MSGTPPPPRQPSPKPAFPVVKRRSSRTALVSILVVAVLVAAGLTAAYEDHWLGNRGSNGNCGPATLQGDGAQFVAPLVAAWAQAYDAQTGNQVNYPAAGSGTGLTHFSENPPLLDFAITDNPLSSSERAAMPSQPLTIPVIGGALAIVYNVPGVAASVHLNLTGQVVAGIYLGLITHWNNTAITSLNPGVVLPNTTIQTVHRSGSAGTTYVLSDFLSQDNATWNSTVGRGISISWPTNASQTAASSNSVLLSTVASLDDSIGYSDYTDVINLESSVVGYAAIENPSHQFVAPTLANTASAIADKTASLTKTPNATGNWYSISMVNANGSGDYPLATFAYLYVYQAADKGYSPSLVRAEILVQWVEWALTTGQTLASGPNLYYAALPATIIAIDQAGVATMTYNGAAVTSCS
jgi:phosphate transport system substrate-binding protein